MSDTTQPRPLTPDQIRWTCALDALPDFETTDELDHVEIHIGQDRAVEAIEFGVSIPHKGYNLYVLGPAGCGRHELVEQLLDRYAAEREPPSDLCYVHNFSEPLEPRLLVLPDGRGTTLCDDIDALLDDLQTSLVAAFESEDYEARLQAINEEFRERQEEVFEEFRDKARERDIAVLRTPSGVALAPIKDDEVVPPSELDKLDAEEREEVEKIIAELQRDFQEALKNVPRWERERRDRVRELEREVAEFAIEGPFSEIRDDYEDLEPVLEHLEAMQRDVLDSIGDFLRAGRQPPPTTASPTPPGAPQSGPGQGQSGQGQGGGASRQERRDQMRSTRRRIDESDASPLRRYRVNLFVDNSERDGAPVVYEDNPNLENLVGRIEYRAQFGALSTDFQLVRPGALHQANGGYLVVDARKLLANPLVWDQLKRALFSREVRIESTAQIMGMANTVTPEPEPAPLDLKIVLIGERLLYYRISALDPEFDELFKVAADFEEDIERDEAGAAHFARLLATIADEEELLALRPSGVARVFERCVRIAGDRDKVTTRVTFIRDLLREASYWARRRDADAVEGIDVAAAIGARERRESRVRDRLREQILRDTVRVETTGAAVGQINGLSVMTLGQFSFGKPNRISARASLGSGEFVDIEREVELGGPLHSKGVLILSGFLGGRFGADRPLSLRASLVFEQSYGPVDGDSASLAEACALISALAEVPLRQGRAITGSMDQHGHAQAIGGVNEKIEGFFAICAAEGLTGDQGVIIPSSNVRNLMLRPDVVDAVEEGDFSIWAVDHLDEALALLTDHPAGTRAEDGTWTEASVNARVAARLEDLAERALVYSPRRATGAGDEG